MTTFCRFACVGQSESGARLVAAVEYSLAHVRSSSRRRRRGGFSTMPYLSAVDVGGKTQHRGGKTRRQLREVAVVDDGDRMYCCPSAC